MAYISGTGSVNTSQITISTWVNIGALGLHRILEFGGEPDSPSTRKTAASYIALYSDAATWGSRQLEIQFGAAHNSIIADSYVSSDDTAIDGFFDDLQGSTWTPQFFVNITLSGANSTAVTPGDWWHLFIAADFTNSVTLSGTTNRFVVYLNGSQLSIPSDSPVLGRLISAGIVQQGMVYDGSFGAPDPIDGSDPNDGRDFTYGPFSNKHTENLVPGPGTEDVTTTGRVPALLMELSGKEIGIPSQAAHAGQSLQIPDPTEVYKSNLSAIRFSDYQIWIGQYIDPAAHIDKFISGGQPVNPSVPAAAFGDQTYLFAGSSAAFGDNQGTGGAFTKTGTVTDYTPAP